MKNVVVLHLLAVIALSTAQQCLPSGPCNAANKYRSSSGLCNNLNRPEKGSTNTPYIRILAAAYDDGIGIPRSKSVVPGVALPTPRVVSNAVHAQRSVNESKYSVMLTQWGQFIAHDMFLTAATAATDPNGNAVDCSVCKSAINAPNCMPIPIPSNDTFYTPTINADGTPRCLALTRSTAYSAIGVRLQFNRNSHYLDGSVIYGSDDCVASDLRTKTGGLLNFTANLMSTNPMALPQAAGTQQGPCNSLPGHPCFTAGDTRNNQNPQLQVMQTIFLREHNRLAKKLAGIRPTWDDERLYQESRRIVIAQLQHVTYNEFLPRILGTTIWSSKGLSPQPQGKYFTGYDVTADASIMLPFNTAAYRFGHTLVREYIAHLSCPKMTSFAEPASLAQQFFNSDQIYNETSGGVNTMACGMIGKSMKKMDNGIADALRNFLYSVRGNASTGGDLASRNIMRGRDHGLVPYNQWRFFCGLPKAMDWPDLRTTIQAQALPLLKGVYASVDDIDAWTGMISEIPVADGVVGPTAACIIAQQFVNLKKADRFFYESNNANVLFTPAQLDEIRKMTLSGIICQNLPTDLHGTPMANIQPNAFDLPDDVNNPTATSCAMLHMLNLTLFTA